MRHCTNGIRTNGSTHYNRFRSGAMLIKTCGQDKSGYSEKPVTFRVGQGCHLLTCSTPMHRSVWLILINYNYIYIYIFIQIKFIYIYIFFYIFILCILYVNIIAGFCCNIYVWTFTLAGAEWWHPVIKLVYDHHWTISFEFTHYKPYWSYKPT